MSKICCQWREKVELAIEEAEAEILDEAIWCWYRFGIKEKSGVFDCSFCQEKLVEWGKDFGVDFTNSKLIDKTAQEQIEKGEIKCCRIVDLIDLEDPNKDLLYQHALEFKFRFQKRLCFKCLVKLNGILYSYKE